MKRLKEIIKTKSEDEIIRLEDQLLNQIINPYNIKVKSTNRKLNYLIDDIKKAIKEELNRLKENLETDTKMLNITYKKYNKTTKKKQRREHKEDIDELEQDIQEEQERIDQLNQAKEELDAYIQNIIQKPQEAKEQQITLRDLKQYMAQEYPRDNWGLKKLYELLRDNNLINEGITEEQFINDDEIEADPEQMKAMFEAIKHKEFKKRLDNQYDGNDIDTNLESITSESEKDLKGSESEIPEVSFKPKPKRVKNREINEIELKLDNNPNDESTVEELNKLKHLTNLTHEQQWAIKQIEQERINKLREQEALKKLEQYIKQGIITQLSEDKYYYNGVELNQKEVINMIKKYEIDKQMRGFFKVRQDNRREQQRKRQQQQQEKLIREHRYGKKGVVKNNQEVKRIINPLLLKKSY